MSILVPKTEVPRSGAQASLAFLIVFAFIGVIVLWTFYPPPGDPAQISGMINTLIGILAAAATGIVGFYFGSSDASRTKDQTIGDIAKQQTGTGTGTGNGSNAPPAVIVESPSTVTIQEDDDLGDPLPKKP